MSHTAHRSRRLAGLSATLAAALAAGALLVTPVAAAPGAPTLAENGQELDALSVSVLELSDELTAAAGGPLGLVGPQVANGQVHHFPAKADLNERSAPELGNNTVRVDAFRKGDLVPVLCQTRGGFAYGSTIWDKTPGGWVPDHYVKTGADGFAPGVPQCGSNPPAPDQQPPVVADSGFLITADLNGRAVPEKAAPAVKVYAKGSRVQITCQASGGMAYGSTIWDKTSDGLWLPDRYVRTGHSGFAPSIPRCEGAGKIENQPSTGEGKVFRTSSSLRGRATKTVGAPAVKEYGYRQDVTIVCQAYGPVAYGSPIWDKTSDNLWVPDRWIVTGTKGFVDGLPKCDNDPKPNNGGNENTGTTQNPGTGNAGNPGVNPHPSQRAYAPNMSPRTRWVNEAIEAAYGNRIHCTVGGHRSHERSTSNHNTGNALDCTVGNRIGQYPNAGQTATGWEISEWLKRYAPQMQVRYVIWQGKIWSQARNSQGWRHYSVARDVTGGHFDHIHISIQNPHGD